MAAAIRPLDPSDREAAVAVMLDPVAILRARYRIPADRLRASVRSEKPLPPAPS